MEDFEIPINKQFIDLCDAGVYKKSKYKKDIKEFLSCHPKALLCIRQTSSTDFPPFVAIESEVCHNYMNYEGVFELIAVIETFNLED